MRIGRQNVVAYKDNSVDVKETTWRLFRFMFTTGPWLKNTGWPMSYYSYEKLVYVDGKFLKVSYIVESFIARLLSGMILDFASDDYQTMRKEISTEWANCSRRMKGYKS